MHVAVVLSRCWCCRVVCRRGSVHPLAGGSYSTPQPPARSPVFRPLLVPWRLSTASCNRSDDCWPEITASLLWGHLVVRDDICSECLFRRHPASRPPVLLAAGVRVSQLVCRLHRHHCMIFQRRHAVAAARCGRTLASTLVSHCRPAALRVCGLLGCAGMFVVMPWMGVWLVGRIWRGSSRGVICWSVTAGAATSGPASATPRCTRAHAKT